MTDTPTTRPTMDELREILAEELERLGCTMKAARVRNQFTGDLDVIAALAALFRVTLPTTHAGEGMVEDDLREAAIRDRAYVLGMKQVLREVWPFIRENDRWWDALAEKLKELDARTKTIDKGALRILLDSASPQPDRESEVGPLLAALIEISNFPYAGAPDIQMRKIARAAVEKFSSSTRPQATEEGK